MRITLTDAEVRLKIKELLTLFIFMQPDLITTKVLIIGGGPVGLFAVFMCGMMGFKSCLLDALPQLGGQCQVLYPDKPIYDIPGFTSISGEHLVEALKNQMAPFSPQIFLQEQVTHLSQYDEATWHVTTASGKIFATSAVILCTGGGSFVPQRPSVEQLDRFETHSVVYHIPCKEFFRDKRVVIAGGGDSAVDWAVSLQSIAREVHVVHRRPQFRAQDRMVQTLHELHAQEKIHLHIPFQLHALQGTEGLLSQVIIKDFSENTHTIDADYLLPFFGMVNDLGPLAQWGLTLVNKRIQTDPLTGLTNLKGIYAAGDIATYPHKLKLIMTGFSEVAHIAHHIKGYLHPEKAHSFQHSTTQGIPKILE
jgi:thioredoxin reductase (NADPH)